MGQEIERKFLVCGDYWKSVTGQKFYQGYLSTVSGRTVRVRIAGAKAFLTIKGESKGLKRAEFEYEISVKDAREMLEDICEKPIIEKIRREIHHEGHKWEVDEFAGENAGLVIAEIELAFEDEKFSKPVWLGAEVTSDKRYYNSQLVKDPYCNWKEKK